jgi:hypothetical protein
MQPSITLLTAFGSILLTITSASPISAAAGLEKRNCIYGQTFATEAVCQLACTAKFPYVASCFSVQAGYQCTECQKG